MAKAAASKAGASKAAASARRCRGAAKRRQPTETDDPESLERARRERLVQKAIESLHDRQTLRSANVPKKVPEAASDKDTDKEAPNHAKYDSPDDLTSISEGEEEPAQDSPGYPKLDLLDALEEYLGEGGTGESSD